MEERSGEPEVDEHSGEAVEEAIGGRKSVSSRGRWEEESRIVERNSQFHPRDLPSVGHDVGLVVEGLVQSDGGKVEEPDAVCLTCKE